MRSFSLGAVAATALWKSAHVSASLLQLSAIATTVSRCSNVGGQSLYKLTGSVVTRLSGAPGQISKSSPSCLSLRRMQGFLGYDSLEKS